MEAAALYAFAAAQDSAVLCFARVANRKGQPGIFEKGEADGPIAALALVRAAAEAWAR